MHTPLLIAEGFLIGLSLAAPVGPMGLLCIQKTLAGGFVLGMLTGIGIALADAIYGMMAAFGVTAISDFLIAHKSVLSFGGGLFLIWIGIKNLFSKPSLEETAVLQPREHGFSAFSTAFLLTLTNPLTVFTYIAIFAGASINVANNWGAIAITLAIFAGSMAWWLMLSGFVALTKAKIRPRHVGAISHVSGIILVGFGLYALSSAFLK